MAEIEIPHHVEGKDQKQIGVLIAVIAVIMAVVSSLGKHAANEMIVNEVKSSNDYAWYQAKRQREYVNEIEIRRLDIELLANPTGIRKAAVEKFKADLLAKNTEYQRENQKIKELGDAAKLHAKIGGAKNETFDHSEILLQIAMVLCSLTLLTGLKLFTRIGLAAAAAGVVFGILAFTRNDVPLDEGGHVPAGSGHSVPAH